MTVRIQCPTCQRQFKVAEELKGRTVECGGCEKQFVVDDDAIVPERERYFPGDIKKPGLDHYAMAPSSGQVPQVQFATATYNQNASAADVAPPSPQRTVASIFGALIQVLFIVILIFGSQPDGVLGDMELEKRVILGAFVALVGTILILYGGFRRRKKMVFGGFALAGTLVVLSVVLPVHGGNEGRIAAGNGSSVAPKPTPLPVVPEMTELEARDAMNYDPVEKAMATLSPESVVGLWAPIMKQRFRYQIQRFLQRKTGTAARPSFYTRGKGGLFVIEGTTLDLPEIEQLVTRFAEIDQVYENLRVLKITIKGDNLLEPSSDLERKLNNTNHEDFYSANLTELNHLVLDRAREAAQRLAGVEPVSYRPQIAKRLVELLDEDDDPDYRATICNAILVWSDPDDPSDTAVTAVARVVQDLIISEQQVPRTMLEFLMARESPEVIALLELLWKKKPTEWEPLLIDVGSSVETAMVSYLADEDSGRQRSALVIIRRVGTAASLPALRQARESAAPEPRLLIDQAIQAIEGGAE